MAPLRYKYKDPPPFVHQKRALAKIDKLDGVCGLFMEMGTAKTRVAIDWAGICYQNRGLRRVLVVAPLSVLSVWKRQIRMWSPIPARIAVMNGSTTNKIRLIRLMKKYRYRKGIEWIVINYESVWRETGKLSLEKELQRWKPDLVIADESHRIKSPSARQSRSLARIGNVSHMRLALTGTPITKSPLDVFGQFRFLNSTIFGTNYGSFKNYYGVWGGYLRYQLRGYKHLTELTQNVRSNSYRIKKEQCLDLPEKIFEDIPVELGERAKKIYKQMADEMIAEIESDIEATAPIVLTKLLRLSQITSGFVKDVDGVIRDFDDSKLRVCVDLIQDAVDSGEKIVVFCRFIHDYQALATALARRKIKTVILSGSVKQADRDSLIEEFNGGSTPVFIAQIASGSLGIDLTAASHAIFFSLDYRWEHYVQAQDRLHRQGQTKRCTYYHLVAPGTIDALTLQILGEKGRIANAVIHDPEILRPKF